MTDNAANEFRKLVDVVAKLRGDDGCPWDKQQTHESLRKFVIEETYEVVEAVDRGEDSKLKEELGDLLLQTLLHARIAEERGAFDAADVCRAIREKLLRRHPHVFGDVKVAGVDEVLHNWEEIKAGEPGYEDRQSVLDGVPKSLPALVRASEMSKRAAKVGFEWPDISGVLDKLREETGELLEAIEAARPDEIKREIGDLLFVIVNIARFVGVDPEESLREMLKRFSSRFRQIEERAKSTGRGVSEMTLAEMDAIWDEAKNG